MYFDYVRKHILNWKNFILFLIFLFTNLAILLSISVGYTFALLKQSYFYKYSGFRTIIVDSNDINNLKKINHVLAVEDAKYRNPLTFSSKDFDSDLKGEILINALISKEDLKIKRGRMIKNANEAICSDTFFPYEIEVRNGKTIFNKSRIISGKSILNKSFSIYENDEKIATYDIVGTFDTKKTMNALNSCYILKDDFEKIIQDESDLEQSTSNSNESGSMLLVDKYENVENVLKELKKRNDSYYVVSELNEGYIKILTYFPIFASIINSLLFMIVLESFLSKKIKYRSKCNAILKSIGFENRKIENINILENVILFFISFFISIILYLILFFYIKNVLLAEYIYDGTFIPFSIIPIILSFILEVIIILLVNKRVLRFKLNKSVEEILL